MKKYNKKTFLLLLLMMSFGSSSVYAQALSSNEDESDSSTTNSTEENIVSEENATNNERIINDLIMASGGKLSQGGIEEISSLQEERSLLEARINTAESRQKYIEIEQKIREMGGGSDMDLPIMLSSYGINGNLKAVIEYGNEEYVVSRGTFIDSNWVVRKITKDSVLLVNIDNKSEMSIGIASPSFIK